MKKLAFVIAVGATALLTGFAANASETIRTNAGADATQQSTDISSRGRDYNYGYRHGYRHYGVRNYRPYYGNSYGYYAPSPYGGYGYGGPGINFSFGGGRGW